VEGDLDSASAHLKNAALEKSDRIEAYFAAGLIFRKTGQYERAAYVLESILRGSDLDTQTRKIITRELAKVMFESGNYATASSMLEMTTDKDAMMLRARALRKLERFEDAANLYKSIAKAEKINTDRETGYCYYRCAMQAEGSRRAKFLKYAQKYIPQSRCVGMAFIDSSLLAGKPGRAIADIERFIQNDLPASQDDMAKFQSVFFDAKKTEELMRIVTKHIRSGSSNPFLYIFASSRLMHGDNRQKAAEILDEHMDRFGFSNTVARASVEITPNSVLSKYLENAHYYKCNFCNAETVKYSDVCPACQSFETIKPI
jgi:lipopolysaccharide biosynthesis regulator YciM